MAAHAVGDDEEPVLLQDGKAVLIVVALKPHIADPGRYRAHAILLNATSVPKFSASTFTSHDFMGTFSCQRKAPGG
jgi:hypothetical protein